MTTSDMKRYLLFAWADTPGPDGGVPMGGWGDFEGSFDSVEAAKAHINTGHEHQCAVGHIVDGQTGEKVDDWYVWPWR